MEKIDRLKYNGKLKKTMYLRTIEESSMLPFCADCPWLILIILQQSHLWVVLTFLVKQVLSRLWFCELWYKELKPNSLHLLYLTWTNWLMAVKTSLFVADDLQIRDFVRSLGICIYLLILRIKTFILITKKLTNQFLSHLLNAFRLWYQSFNMQWTF